MAKTDAKKVDIKKWIPAIVGIGAVALLMIGSLVLLPKLKTTKSNEAVQEEIEQVELKYKTVYEIHPYCEDDVDSFTSIYSCDHLWLDFFGFLNSGDKIDINGENYTVAISLSKQKKLDITEVQKYIDATEIQSSDKEAYFDGTYIKFQLTQYSLINTKYLDMISKQYGSTSLTKQLSDSDLESLPAQIYLGEDVNNLNYGTMEFQIKNKNAIKSESDNYTDMIAWLSTNDKGTDVGFIVTYKNQKYVVLYNSNMKPNKQNIVESKAYRYEDVETMLQEN